jgi:hypothetical protein
LHISYKYYKGDLRLYVVELVYKNFMRLIEFGRNEECIKMLVNMKLLKEDVIGLEEILGRDLYKKVPAKDKASLTRECKKQNISVPVYEIMDEESETEE